MFLQTFLNFSFAFLTVSKRDFLSLYPNNPVNLFSKGDKCNNPQPRYKKHSNFKAADTKYQYLSYNQCLPGCVVLNKTTHNVTTEIRNDNAGPTSQVVPITDHLKCKAYDSPRRKSTGNGGQSLKRSTEDSETSFNPSKKLFIWYYLNKLTYMHGRKIVYYILAQVCMRTLTDF